MTESVRSIQTKSVRSIRKTCFSVLFILLILVLGSVLLASCLNSPYNYENNPQSSSSSSSSVPVISEKKVLTYEKPKKTELTDDTVDLDIKMIPFVYNSLYNIRNLNDPIKAAEILGEFEYLVCAEPEHLVKKEILVTDAIKSKVKIFGYISLGGSPLAELSKLEAEIDNISKHGWYGVFIDQFGYDYGDTRERQNAIVRYVHKAGLKCFVNSWFIDDAFSDDFDSVGNPTGLRSELGEGDWYLLESFLTSNRGYSSSMTDFFEKIRKAQLYKDEFNIKIACLTYKRDSINWEESAGDMMNSYMLSAFAGFDGWWFTDRIENDEFNFGKPEFELSDPIIKRLKRVSPYYLLAQTSKQYVLYDTRKFPFLNHEVFGLESKRDLIKYLLNCTSVKKANFE